MKKLIFLFLSLINSVMAQMAPQPLPELEHLEGQSYLFQWEGVPGRVYFIQTSSQNPSATGFSWQFAPDIRVGVGNQIEMGFEANAANTEFFRLVYTDYSGSQDPNFADFDNDGYTNLEEAIANTDPFDAQYFPGGSNGGGNNGGGGSGGNGGGSNGGGGNGGGATNWNHLWEYKLTYEVGQSVTEDTINPYNAVGDYSYVRSRGNATELITKLTFEDVVGTNKVRFLQSEPNENHDSSDQDSLESTFVGVVELSEDDPEWSYSATVGTKYDGELTPVTVERVGFSGTDYYELKSDDLIHTYSASHYNRVFNYNTPVAFRRSSKPEVEAFFVLDLPPELIAKTKIKGEASDGVIFPAQTIVDDPNSDLMKYLKKEATTAFPNEIKFYDKSVDEESFKIDWQISVNGSPYKSIGETKHQIYLTLESPSLKLSGYHETLFWLSCKAGDGKTNINELIIEVWKVFETREVKTVDGKELFYYKIFSQWAGDTAPLLSHHDGGCGAWVRFFLDISKAHGFDPVDDHVEITPTFGNHIMINSWDNFGANGSSNLGPTYTHLNIPLPHPPELGIPPEDNKYHWLYQEEFDKNENIAGGIPGQGENGNPGSIFNNHQLAFINGVYYDPSYGKKYYFLSEIENESIARYAQTTYKLINEDEYNMDLNGDGDMLDNGIQIEELNIRDNPEFLMLLQEVFKDE